MLRNKTSNARFLITYSLGSDTADIKNTYQKMCEIYGPNIRESTAVLITKVNMAN